MFYRNYNTSHTVVDLQHPNYQADCDLDGGKQDTQLLVHLAKLQQLLLDHDPGQIALASKGVAKFGQHGGIQSSDPTQKLGISMDSEYQQHKQTDILSSSRLSVMRRKVRQKSYALTLPCRVNSWQKSRQWNVKTVWGRLKVAGNQPARKSWM